MLRGGLMKRLIILSVLILVFLMILTSCKSIGDEINTFNDIVVEDMNPTETTSQQ